MNLIVTKLVTPGQCLAISTYFSHLTKPNFSIVFKTSLVTLGHPGGGNLYQIGPNKFMGGGWVW